MEINIKKALPNEALNVLGFYHYYLDNKGILKYAPPWIKGVYPSDEFIISSVKNGNVYVAESGDEIVSAMIMDGNQNDGYEQIEWPTPANKGEFLVIHTFCVKPELTGNGIGKLMIKKAIEVGKEQDKKSLRLDVLDGNIPAGKLYSALGFDFVKTVELFYENTGVRIFHLYEYKLK